MGSGSYDYKWAYKKDGSTLITLKDFGTGATSTLAATELPGTGVYTVYVYIKNSGSPASYELYKGISYTINGP